MTDAEAHTALWRVVDVLDEDGRVVFRGRVFRLRHTGGGRILEVCADQRRVEVRPSAVRLTDEPLPDAVPV